VVVVDLQVVLVELEVELEVVFVEVVLDELVVDALALRTYPSEAVKFKLGESGKFVASDAVLATFQIVQMTSSSNGLTSV
jgi:hypothetical protein